MKQSALKTITEVSEEVGVAQHVLRFWEREFPVIRIMKRNGRRLYNVNNVAIIRKIKDLLYEKGYTIKGVKKIFNDKQVDEERYKECVTKVLSDLQEIYDFISKKYGM